MLLLFLLALPQLLEVAFGMKMSTGDEYTKDQAMGEEEDGEESNSMPSATAYKVGRAGTNVSVCRELQGFNLASNIAKLCVLKHINYQLA